MSARRASTSRKDDDAAGKKKKAATRAASADGDGAEPATKKKAAKKVAKKKAPARKKAAAADEDEAPTNKKKKAKARKATETEAEGAGARVRARAAEDEAETEGVGARVRARAAEDEAETEGAGARVRAPAAEDEAEGAGARVRARAAEDEAEGAGARVRARGAEDQAEGVRARVRARAAEDEAEGAGARVRARAAEDEAEGVGARVRARAAEDEADAEPAPARKLKRPVPDHVALPAFGAAGRDMMLIPPPPWPDAPAKAKRARPARKAGPPADAVLPSFLPTRIARAARDVFGIERLHAEQARAIEAVLTGHDAMTVLPTGFGKSLIYQVPAVVKGSPVLVVSPLIALMRDQEQKLLSRGVPVVRLDSTLKAQERRDAIARVAEGGRLVVLTTPETLQSKDAKPAIQKARPELLAVDEAHCISEWGHDFRPAYLQLAEAREQLGIKNIIALTATATPQVREDIAQRLGLKEPVIVVAPPHRANLRLGVHVVSGPSVKLEIAGRILQRLPRPGILYCATTRAVDDIFAALSQTKIPCAKYHGGLPDDERTAAQARFMAKDSRIVMIATSAFGMGIDKPDIRYIVHFQVPGSLEQYVQEAGRAGRDGKQSDCVLLFDKADLQIQEFLESLGRPSGAQIKRVADTISVYSLDESENGVSPNDLAAAASVPAGVAKAVCTELADAGLIEFEGRKASTKVDAKTLKKSAQDLAIRFDILAMQDKKRLDAITNYAEIDECRSVFIRRWFGEKEPPRCGHCDVCRIGERVKALEEAEARGEAPPPPDIYDATARPLPQAGRAVSRGRGGRGRPPHGGRGGGGRGGGGRGRGGRNKRKGART